MTARRKGHTGTSPVCPSPPHCLTALPPHRRSERALAERRTCARAGGGAQPQTGGVALPHVLDEELPTEAVGLLRVLVVIALTVLADLREALEPQLPAGVAERLEGVLALP